MPYVDNVRELFLTTEEALQLVKRSERMKGCRWAAMLRYDAPVPSNPGHCFPNGCHSYINLSKADTMRIVKSLLSSTLEERGGRIHITERISTSESLGTRITYWID